MRVAFSIERHGMWLAIPCLVTAVLLLVRSITGVVRTVRQARLFTASLVETQEVEFPDAGCVVLAVEGPLLSRRHVGLRYEVVGPYGQRVPGRRLLFRAVTSGWSTSSIQLMAFEIERPGRHILRLQGLGGAKPDDAKHRIVFLRPHLAKTVVYIVVILFAAGVAIGSLLLFLWGLLGRT